MSDIQVASFGIDLRASKYTIFHPYALVAEGFCKGSQYGNINKDGDFAGGVEPSIGIVTREEAAKTPCRRLAAEVA